MPIAELSRGPTWMPPSSLLRLQYEDRESYAPKAPQLNPQEIVVVRGWDPDELTENLEIASKLVSEGNTDLTVAKGPYYGEGPRPERILASVTEVAKVAEIDQERGHVVVEETAGVVFLKPNNVTVETYIKARDRLLDKIQDVAGRPLAKPPVGDEIHATPLYVSHKTSIGNGHKQKVLALRRA